MLKLDTHESRFPLLSWTVVWTEEREKEMEIRRLIFGPSDLDQDLPHLTIEVAHALTSMI